MTAVKPLPMYLYELTLMGFHCHHQQLPGLDVKTLRQRSHFINRS
ncbi:MAG: hypothetical protein RMX96_01800 [Nostoc sp. ChiSLP02]|nr:hypothetical protein [Nostoc sp. DedSLP05]MDZ8098803.1 hypothetical protein [Nostoc sp. DedSLP01]MDZ8183583.1 hypothetical protein [Nostoc sp. ChiSLP02]